MDSKIIYHFTKFVVKLRKLFSDTINKLNDQTYVFWVTLVFYVLLLLTNASNYIIAGSFILLLLAFLIKIRNLTLSLFYIFVASLIIFTGKSYPIQLLPIGFFPEAIFPQGYFIYLVITPSYIISFFLVIQIIKQIVAKKVNLASTFKFNLSDLLIVIFFVLKIMSALLASKNPQLSIASEVLSLNGLILYIYARLLIKPNEYFWKVLVFLLSSLVLFEVILSVPEIISKSPIYRNLEFQVNIEYFGNTVDESQFTFRPVGTFDHANTLGVWLASTVIFLFPFIKKAKSNIVWVSFLFGVTILITTISRTAWLGFAIALLFLIIIDWNRTKDIVKYIFEKMWKLRLILIPLLISLTFIYIVPRIENSLYSFNSDAGALYYRLIQDQDSLELIKLHPLLGVGAFMGVYEGITLDLYTVAASVPLQIHNWYLLVALENGILALLSFIFFVLLSVRKFSYSTKVFRPEQTAIMAIIAASSLMGIFQPYININFIILLLSLSNSAIIGSQNA